MPGLALAEIERGGKALKVEGRRAALPLGHLVMTPEAMVKTWLMSRGVFRPTKVKVDVAKKRMQGIPQRTCSTVRPYGQPSSPKRPV